MEATEARSWAIGDVIDLGRYPIAKTGAAPARLLIQDCRSQLKTRGACQLQGFMRQEAVQAVLREARALERLAHRTEAMHNGYFSEDQPALAADDPRRSQVRSAKRAIGWNQIGSRSPLRLL
jgi:hypothetical protein